MTKNTVNEKERMVVTRVFDAPRALVWKAWTDPQYVMQLLSDPAAVSGHLAVCGVPTGASQPLRCCRPAVKYLTRLNRFTFVTARSSLCLRLARFVTSSNPRLDSR